MRTNNTYTAVQLHSIQAYTKMGLTPKVIQKRLNADYSPTTFPLSTIRHYRKKSKTCDDVAVKKVRSPRRRPARSEANIERVIQHYTTTGEKSVRKIAKDMVDLNISRGTIRRIVREAGLETNKKPERNLLKSTKTRHKPKLEESCGDFDQGGSTSQSAISVVPQPSTSTPMIPPPVIIQNQLVASSGFCVNFTEPSNHFQQTVTTVCGNLNIGGPGVVTPQQATNAKIYWSQAGSALDFNDFASAIVNLKLALNALESGHPVEY